MSEYNIRDYLSWDSDALIPIEETEPEESSADSPPGEEGRRLFPKQCGWTKSASANPGHTQVFTFRGQWTTRPDWPWCTIKGYVPVTPNAASKYKHVPHMCLLIRVIGVYLQGGVAHFAEVGTTYANADVFQFTFVHPNDSKFIYMDLTTSPNDLICHDNENHPTDPARIIP